jgi:hypothetical protein
MAPRLLWSDRLTFGGSVAPFRGRRAKMAPRLPWSDRLAFGGSVAPSGGRRWRPISFGLTKGQTA